MPEEEGPTLDVAAVDAADIEKWRDIVSPWLYGVDACSGGTNDLESTFDLCKSGVSQLWVALEGTKATAAFVSDVVSYPRAKVVKIWAAGGDVRGLLKCHQVMDDYARDQGAIKIQFEVPPWAERVAQGFNLTPVRVILERDLYSKGAGNG